MKQTRLWTVGALGALSALSTLGLAASSLQAAPKKPAKKATIKKTAAKKPAKSGSNASMMPLMLSLPAAVTIGTPKNLPPGLVVEKYSPTPRKPMMVPKGTVLLSKGKPVTSSDSAPVIGELSLITDGSKDAGDGNFVELGPYKQWVQIDLGRTATISSVALWHYHSEFAVYKDVVVQVSNDADFVEGVTTVFDNTSKPGSRKDPLYFESFQGRVIDAKGVKGRYVRLSSNGSTSGDENRYTEVEVYGK